MSIHQGPDLSDRQARAVILAAEALGFEREPDLAPAWYDHDLHEDARCAIAHLQDHDPSRLAAALDSPEPIPPRCAAWRITQTKGFTLADARSVVDLGSELGLPPPPCDLPLLPIMLEFDQARAAVAFLWEHDPERLTELIGERARLAPLPESALSWDGCCGQTGRCRCTGRP